MKYTQITLAEMKTFLGTKFTENNSNVATREYVFDHMINDDVVVRIYSSIHKDSNVGRSCGQDAIRICAVNITKRLGWIRTTRVLRVEGWKNNLGRAITRTITQAADRCRKYNSITKVSTKQTPIITEKVQQDLGNPTVEELKTIVQATWTDCKRNTWSTESSDLDCLKEQIGRRDLCPSCAQKFSTANLVRELRSNDEDNELQGWIFKCPHCGAELHVFND